MPRDYLLGLYELDSDVSSGGATVWYSLIFKENGNIAVEQHRDLNQPHRKDKVTDLLPESWDNIKVNGIPLRELAIKKLKEILPKPEPSKSCIKPN